MLAVTSLVFFYGCHVIVCAHESRESFPVFVGITVFVAIIFLCDFLSSALKLGEIVGLLWPILTNTSCLSDSSQ